MKSSSSSKSKFFDRLFYLWDLWRASWNTRNQDISFANIFANIGEYNSICLEHLKKPLKECKTLEIGHGQRPFRLLAIRSLGTDARGIDLDQVVWNLKDLGKALILNGYLRFLKAGVRVLVFDKRVYQRFSNAMKNAGFGRPVYEQQYFRQGDVANEQTWVHYAEELDFIYSEDVFEHIPKDRLPYVLMNMRKALKEGGIAVIRPMVFTGICGGHQIEWYPDRVRNQTMGSDAGKAWSHLTDEFDSADTYLNRLSRREYRILFESVFDVLEDVAVDPDLGRSLFTPEIANQLKNFDDYELFSNNVRFILRAPKRDSVKQ